MVNYLRILLQGNSTVRQMPGTVLYQEISRSYLYLQCDRNQSQLPVLTV